MERRRSNRQPRSTDFGRLGQGGGRQKRPYRFANLAGKDISLITMKIFGINIFAHRRRRPAQTIREARDLIERFMNDRPGYDFEWDDFISWKNENPTIEKVRENLEVVEALLISDDPLDRQRAMSALRNGIAYLDAFL